MQIKLTFSKSTKGTHVYSADVPDAPVPTLYVRRDALPKNPPGEITVTIDYADSTPIDGSRK